MEEKVQNVISGTEFSFALSAEGSLFGWGWNEHLNLSSCGEWSLNFPKLITTKHRCHRAWAHPAITIVEYIR